MSDVSPALSLGQGIHRITLPLPFRSPPSVNAYIVEGSDSLVLIDCGTDWEEGREALFRGLQDLDLSPDAITKLIVSHLHPDHVGMAPRLIAEWGVQTVMHSRAAKLVTRYNDSDDFRRRTRELADRHGVPHTARPAFIDVGERPSWMPPIDPPDATVDDGDSIPVDGNRHLEVFFTPGHEAAHICLRDSLTSALFAGDHILPRITPYVGYDEMFEDVLGEFLDSLRKIERLLVTTTYPAHGAVIEHGSARAEQIFLHHQRRLEGMVEAVDPDGSTAWMVMEKVFRPNLSPMDQRLALRETIAHLEHLRLQSCLRSKEEAGTLRYLRLR
ncbi:MAG TPA: MBL fold metallo-hydrolase [Acidimicrobiia bacterium]|nr:MBL fold metallo-hydrolase [Acidimicrobiia bacterium]